MNWQTYIQSDPEVLLGKPTIKGTRLSVALILELIGKGWRQEDLLRSYPALTPDTLQAVYAYLHDCRESSPITPPDPSGSDLFSA